MLVKFGSPAAGGAASATPAPEKHSKTNMAAIRRAGVNMVFSSLDHCKTVRPQPARSTVRADAPS
jgi:hypothetical protein